MPEKIVYLGDIIRAKYLNKFLPKEETKNKRCLDIGCENGRYKDSIEKKGYIYFGVDINPTELNDYMQRMDATDLHIANETYDCVICIDVLEHIQKPEEAISEMFRVLKKDCSAYIHIPNSEQSHILFPHPHQQDHVVEGFTRTEIRDLILKEKFNHVNIIPSFNFHEMLAWEINYLFNVNKPESLNRLDLTRLIEFTLIDFQSGGFLAIAKK